MPAGVNLPVDVVELPLNAALSFAPVPVNEGCDTLPDGVNLPVEVIALPLNAAVRRTPVPVNEPVAVALFIPVATVVSEPFVGKVPALNEMVSSSLLTLVVSEGSVPTAVIEFTVAVFTVTVGETLTEPAGV